MCPCVDQILVSKGVYKTLDYWVTLVDLLINSREARCYTKSFLEEVEVDKNKSTGEFGIRQESISSAARFPQ
jgi:hypothetical protein